MEEPQEPVETILEKEFHKRKPTWAWELIREAERYDAPEGIHRERKRENPYNSYVALLCDIIDKEPSTYEEAIEKKEWKDAMIEEYHSIMKNDVWEVVLRPEEKSVVTLKWIYKINHTADSSIEKHKARFVVHGFCYKEGIYYEETFAPIARYTSIRSILELVAVMKWKVHQMEVMTTFLIGVVEEEVYVE